jgi:FKBP-type peptidyl-prolyl cis-trans isomerase
MTDSVKIETLAEGMGRSPAAGDTVVVHYTGRLENGTSSTTRATAMSRSNLSWAAAR